MKIVLIFGFILQCIVSIWSFFNLNVSLFNLFLWLIFILQIISALICFVAIKQKIWFFSFLFSICSATLLIILMMKNHLGILEILSFIPLVVYYIVLTTYSSYKIKLKKLKVSIEKNEQKNQTTDDE